MSCMPGELNQLHAFARQIGLKRAWFQDKPNGLPHYDLNPNKRVQAVKEGATQVDRRGIVDVMHAWREHRKTEVIQGQIL